MASTGGLLLDNGVYVGSGSGPIRNERGEMQNVNVIRPPAPKQERVWGPDNKSFLDNNGVYIGAPDAAPIPGTTTYRPPLLNNTSGPSSPSPPTPPSTDYTPPTAQPVETPNFNETVSGGVQQLENLGGTVEGRLANLLRKGSPLLEQAKTRTKQEANKLGLLNTTMAVGAGKNAVISKGLEIVSPDAQNISNIVGYGVQGNISAGLADQEAAHNIEALNVDAANRMQIEGMAQGSQTYRMQLENASRERIAQMDIDASNRQAYMGSIEAIGRQYDADYTNILTSPNFASPEEREAALRLLTHNYQQSMGFVSQAAGVELSWSNRYSGTGGASPTPDNYTELTDQIRQENLEETARGYSEWRRNNPVNDDTVQQAISTYRMTNQDAARDYVSYAQWVEQTYGLAARPQNPWGEVGGSTFVGLSPRGLLPGMNNMGRAVPQGFSAEQFNTLRADLERLFNATGGSARSSGSDA